MSGRDLDRAAPGFGISVLVRNDRNEPVGERQANRFSDEIGKTRITRMNSDTGIAQHGFGPSRGYDDEPAGKLGERIADVPQRAFGFAALDFEIRDHGVHYRVPVDEPLVTINEAFAIELDEDASHRRREARVHREAFAAPIRRDTEPAQLMDDGAARLLFPFPDARDEPRAAEIMFRLALVGELIANHNLGSNAGVIGAGLPQHVATPHALIADQHILQRKVQSVPNMKATGNVWGRHHDGVGPPVAVGIGGKTTGTLPQRIAARLYGGRMISLVQHL